MGSLSIMRANPSLLTKPTSAPFCANRPKGCRALRQSGRAGPGGNTRSRGCPSRYHRACDRIINRTAPLQKMYKPSGSPPWLKSTRSLSHGTGRRMFLERLNQLLICHGMLWGPSSYKAAEYKPLYTDPFHRPRSGKCFTFVALEWFGLRPPASGIESRLSVARAFESWIVDVQNHCFTQKPCLAL